MCIYVYLSVSVYVCICLCVQLTAQNKEGLITVKPSSFHKETFSIQR